MITPSYAQLMAAYNQWQNKSLYDAALSLSDEARKADRGAFFGSIHETLCHVLWADRIWLSRLADHPAPEAKGVPGSTSMYEEWDALAATRRDTDWFIEVWADGLQAHDLQGDLTWYSGVMGKEIAKPKWLLVTHLFNHQTHHRGQVHAMLTAAGARPEDTDIPFMPA